MERDEQGRLGGGGKRSGGEPSPPGVERGGGDPLTRAEFGDRQAAGGLPPEALPPGVFETEVFGTCHELAPGLEEGDQPSSIAALARLVLPCPYPGDENIEYHEPDGSSRSRHLSATRI